MKLLQRWKHHLSENQMTYCEHLMFALGHGFVCVKAGWYLIVHGILPCFYQKAGSNLIRTLDKAFKRNQDLR
jgi:hypothetical protein